MRKKSLFAVALACGLFVADISSAQDVDGVTINGITWATCNVGFRGEFVDNPLSQGISYTYDVAMDDACPSGWRLPTSDEFETLTQTEYEWTTQNDINGCLFVSGNNSIFLPAEHNTYASYWSSSLSPDDSTLTIGWMITKVNGISMNPAERPLDPYHRSEHMFVRCVKQ